MVRHLGLLLFIGIFTCSVSCAKEYQVVVPHMQIYKSKIGNLTPIKYVFNKNGQLLYKKAHSSSDIVKFLSDTPPLDTSEKELEILRPFLPKDYNFAESNYTIVLLRGEDSDSCPPCKKHEIQMRKLHDKLSHKNINLVQVIIDYEDTVTTNMLSDEEWKKQFKASGN